MERVLPVVHNLNECRLSGAGRRAMGGRI